jgi:hypothetical protein
VTDAGGKPRIDADRVIPSRGPPNALPCFNRGSGSRACCPRPVPVLESEPPLAEEKNRWWGLYCQNTYSHSYRYLCCFPHHLSSLLSSSLLSFSSSSSLPTSSPCHVFVRWGWLFASFFFFTSLASLFMQF